MDNGRAKLDPRPDSRHSPGVLPVVKSIAFLSPTPTLESQARARVSARILAVFARPAMRVVALFGAFGALVAVVRPSPPSNDIEGLAAELGRAAGGGVVLPED